MTTNELLAHRIMQLEHDMEQIVGKVDKLVLAIMGLALTLGTSAIVFALSVISLRSSK